MALVDLLVRDALHIDTRCDVAGKGLLRLVEEALLHQHVQKRVAFLHREYSWVCQQDRLRQVHQADQSVICLGRSRCLLRLIAL